MLFQRCRTCENRAETRARALLSSFWRGRSGYFRKPTRYKLVTNSLHDPRGASGLQKRQNGSHQSHKMMQNRLLKSKKMQLHVRADRNCFRVQDSGSAVMHFSSASCIHLAHRASAPRVQFHCSAPSRLLHVLPLQDFVHRSLHHSLAIRLPGLQIA